MSRRALVVGGAAVVAVALVLAVLPGRRERRPDVLLLTIDTLRPDYLSVNGYDRPTSPVLDALIRSGWYFRDAASPIGHTTPAFASLFTGAYPHNTGVIRLWDNLPEGVETLTQVLQAAGWDTFAVVANAMLSEKRGLGRGFRVYDCEKSTHGARATTDAALRELAAAPKGRPCFAWVHYIDPHMSYRPDPAVIQEFDPGYRGPYAASYAVAVQDVTASPEKVKRMAALLPKEEAVFRNPLPPEVLAHIRLLYAAEIRTADNEIARLIDAFRARSGGRLVIVFTADHGESMGEHDYYFEHGDYAYEADLRIPLAFVLPPGDPRAGAGVVPGRVSLVDLAPTILEVLHLKAPDSFAARFEGQSLVASFGGEAPSRAVFGESGHSQFTPAIRRRIRFDDEARFRCVVRDGWKLIWTPFQTGALEWELYDLEQDPHETEDQWQPDAPRFAPLEDELRSWLARGAADRETPAIDPDDMEALRALGYVR